MAKTGSRLKQLGPRIGSLPPRFGHLGRAEVRRDFDRWRLENQEWRRWYGLQRWKDLRWSVLERDGFTCQICGRLEGDTSQLVADHVEPHMGDPEKFWSGELQTLCKSCHDSTKQSMERGQRKANGRPSWLKPSAVPLVMVCGPPASGKTTYVKARAGPNDIVIDLDEIVARLSGGPSHGWDRERWLHPALFRRNAMLGDLSRASSGRAWFILTEPTAKGRQWWADKLRPERIVVIETPERQCIANAALDATRPAKPTADAIVDWWFRYRPRQGDVRLAWSDAARPGPATGG